MENPVIDLESNIFKAIECCKEAVVELLWSIYIDILHQVAEVIISYIVPNRTNLSGPHVWRARSHHGIHDRIHWGYKGHIEIFNLNFLELMMFGPPCGRHRQHVSRGILYDQHRHLFARLV